jgi:hypothetical protein
MHGTGTSFIVSGRGKHHYPRLEYFNFIIHIFAPMSMFYKPKSAGLSGFCRALRPMDHFQE